ncbi:ABC transporter permease [Limnochorda pilosa]|uniref:ABC transporter permease n=1 Tax=Limnochorda pilosa TaxID=1555112 RepID=A0A0K2SR41_LIMPI|nr:ABC transporter permease [Limnochorda pilosa]BAS29289.1 ABC transporter permease [Limnochorda pilosa]
MAVAQDPAPTGPSEGLPLKLHLLRVAAWLGWQHDSNWANPILFALYSVVRPLATMLILVFMFLVVSRQPLGGGTFPAIYLGNAFWMFVGQILMGVSWTIMEDREFYQMIRYILLAAPGLAWYLVGRAAAKLAVTTVAVGVALLAGKLVLGVDLVGPAGLGGWLYFLTALLAGLAVTVAMGLGLAGTMMRVARHGTFYSESVAGALYLFTATVFPLEVLPDWAQALGLAIPQTYWMEALRRSLLPGAAGFSPTLAALSPGEVLMRLVLTGAIFAVLSWAFFVRSEEWARARGELDVVTEH